MPASTPTPFPIILDHAFTSADNVASGGANSTTGTGPLGWTDTHGGIAGIAGGRLTLTTDGGGYADTRDYVVDLPRVALGQEVDLLIPPGGIIGTPTVGLVLRKQAGVAASYYIAKWNTGGNNLFFEVSDRNGNGSGSPLDAPVATTPVNAGHYYLVSARAEQAVNPTLLSITISDLGTGAPTPGPLTNLVGTGTVIGSISQFADSTSYLQASGSVGLDVSGGSFAVAHVTTSAASPLPPPLGDQGFETVVVGTAAGKYQTTPTGSAWSFTGNAGIAANGSTLGNLAAPGGSQCGFVGMGGTITQTLNFPEPHLFQLAFSLGSGSANRAAIQVTLDGVRLLSTKQDHAAWANFLTPPFPVGAGSHTIGFTGATTAVAFLDNVSLSLAGSTPGNTAGLTLGLNSAMYLGDRIFADEVRLANAFAPVSAPYNGPDAGAPLDAAGWPTTDCCVAILQGTGPDDMLDGRRAITFPGKAVVSFEDWTANLVSSHYDSPSNTSTWVFDVAAITGTANGHFTFAQTQRLPTDTLTFHPAVGSTPGYYTGMTGLTNIRIMRPTAPGATTTLDPSLVYTPQAITAFNGAFTEARDLNWSGTNAPDPTQPDGLIHWGDRTLPTNPIQRQPDGIAYEHRIGFCNTAGIDLRICVPYRATSDYITKLGQLGRFGSDGTMYPFTGVYGSTPSALNTKPYPSAGYVPLYAPLKGKLSYETGNEEWNFGTFGTTAGWGLDQAKAEIAACHLANPPTVSELEFGNTAAPSYTGGDTGFNYYWARYRYARQVMTTKSLLDQVYDPATFGVAYGVVLAGQSGDPSIIGAELDWILAKTNGQPHLVIDRIDNGWYANMALGAPDPTDYWYDLTNPLQAQSVDQIFAAGFDAVTRASNVGTPAYAGGRAPLVPRGGYEGGTSISSNKPQPPGNGGETSVITRACDADPRMAAFVIQAIADLFNAGATALTHFCSINGAWSIYASVFNTNTTKYNAYKAVATALRAGLPIPVLPIKTASPQVVAAGATVTHTVQGTNTSWGTGTTFAIAGKSDASIVSQSLNPTTQVATLTIHPGSTSGSYRISNNADASFVGIGVKGGSAPLPSLAATPSAVAGGANVVVALTETGGSLTSGSSFTLSGKSDASLVSTAVNVGTQVATLTIHPGSTAGTITITDPATSATGSIAVTTVVGFDPLTIMLRQFISSN